MSKKSLVEETFSSLPVLGIYKRDDFWLIPSGLAEFDTNISLLNEIYHHYQDDFIKNRHLLKNFPPPNVNEFNKYKLREIWRIGSFIVFALNIELILMKNYKELIRLMEEFESALVIQHDERILKRQQEIKKYKYYRNKIFAHPVYGCPKIEDNLSMQYTSLDYFNATMVGITQDGIRIGGTSRTVEGQKPPKFEIFTFSEMVSDFSKHFLEWRKMYQEICVILQKIKDEEIKCHINGVVRIRRPANIDKRVATNR